MNDSKHNLIYNSEFLYLQKLLKMLIFRIFDFLKYIFLKIWKIKVFYFIKIKFKTIIKLENL